MFYITVLFQNEPVMDVYVEIQSTHIEVYTAKFLLNAHFTGLRYVMFNWPLISAIIGNFFFHIDMVI